MIQTVYTSAVIDLIGELVTVEVDIANGFPTFTLVGLPDAVVRESRERIRTSLINSSLGFPQSRVTVNLLPASCKKAGSHLDLPIALGVLCAGRKSILTQLGALGELSLSGDVLPVKSPLSLLIAMQRKGILKAIIPKGNLQEALALQEFEVFPVETVIEAYKCYVSPDNVKWIKCEGQAKFSVRPQVQEPSPFSLIRGQEEAKRVIEIAAAGGHHLMMMGVPGCGKTMLAKAMASLLPPINYEEQMLITELNGKRLMTKRPFRAPHYTITRTALCGGGGLVRPGEVTLAHLGVLYLDEFLEFSRETIEALRFPMESGEIHISRITGQMTLPARFTLVASFNPCPCGYLGDLERNCTCTPHDVRRYRRRLSGPILDRFDLQLILNRVHYEELKLLESSKEVIEDDGHIKARIERAKEIQNHRFKSSFTQNGHMSQAQLLQACRPDTAITQVLERLDRQYQLSARGIFKVLRVARTIADLAECEEIQKAHVLEAVHYRHVEREVSSRGY